MGNTRSRKDFDPAEHLDSEEVAAVSPDKISITPMRHEEP